MAASSASTASTASPGSSAPSPKLPQVALVKADALSTQLRRRLHAVGCGLLGLWAFTVLGGPVLVAWIGLALNAHGHSHLYAHGHPFVDARVWMGIPNAMDVFSNLPLLLAGLWGGAGLLKARQSGLAAATLNALIVFYLGLGLAALGSSVYHWAPDASSPVLDRLGMAVAFAGALALAVAERVGTEEAHRVMWFSLAAGAVSAVLAPLMGNVLPWVIVQFGGMGLLIWLTSLPTKDGALGVRLHALIALYALAKVLELGDSAVFQLSGQWISGHSLKHVAAALAALPVLAAVRQYACKAAPNPRSQPATSAVR